MFWSIDAGASDIMDGYNAVNNAARAASHAVGDAGRARGAVQDLEERFDRLALVSEALWTLLRDRVGITEAELLDRVREVDLSDGVLDGKVRRPVVDCPSCHRAVSTRNMRCIYCSAELKRPPFAV